MFTLVTLTPEEKNKLLDVCIDRENFYAVAQPDSGKWTLFEKTSFSPHHTNRLDLSFIGVIPPCTALYANCYIQRPEKDASTVRIVIRSVANGNRMSEEPVAVVVASMAGNRASIEASEAWQEIGDVCAAIFARLQEHEPNFHAILIPGVIHNGLLTVFAQSSMNFHRWRQDGDLFRRM